MNRFLPDTNVISELRKPRPHGSVVAWINDLQEEQLFLSAVTMGELEAGIERTRCQDPLKAADIESWADQLATSYQILPMDKLCFREWGRIIDRKPDELFEDAMIARHGAGTSIDCCHAERSRLQATGHSNLQSVQECLSSYQHSFATLCWAFGEATP